MNADELKRLRERASKYHDDQTTPVPILNDLYNAIDEIERLKKIEAAAMEFTGRDTSFDGMYDNLQNLKAAHAASASKGATPMTMTREEWVIGPFKEAQCAWCDDFLRQHAVGGGRCSLCFRNRHLGESCPEFVPRNEAVKNYLAAMKETKR